MEAQYNLNELKYDNDDVRVLYNFILQYRTNLIKKNKSKLNSPHQLKEYYAALEKKANALLKTVPSEISQSFTTESKRIFCLYWKHYKHFKLNRTSKFRNKKLEDKLNKLMYYTAVIEAAVFHKFKTEKIENNSISVKSVIRFNDKACLNTFLSNDIRAVIGSDPVFRTIGIISDAIDRPLTDSFSDTRCMHRMFYIHVGKTNSGKTYDSIKRLLSAESGIYLAPLRLLALEKYDEINSAGVPCSFSTGEEEKIVANAKHISATVEMADFKSVYDVAVIDECQMITDRSRGYAWTKAIIGIRAYEICLCTAPEALNLLVKVIESCGDYYKIVHHRRNTPLIMEEKSFKLDDVRCGDALVAFSKARVNAIASQLSQKGVNVSVLYGALPYEARIKQFESFISGESDVMVCTDAIGMGLNLPIKRIVFMETYKFDGISRRPLTISEIKQIAGRAGRKGIFDVGYVNAYTQAENEYIANALKRRTPKTETVCISFPKQILHRDDVEIISAIRAWQMLRVQDGYVKEDLEEVIIGVNAINRVLKKYDLSAEQYDIFEMAALPVDRNNSGVMSLWCFYVRDRLQGKQKLEKPRLKSKSVEDLLTFFKKLDAYFICSRAWDMDYDAAWAEEERSDCASLINEILISDLENHIKTCTGCGIKLEWNNIGSYCALCRYKRNIISTSRSFRK